LFCVSACSHPHKHHAPISFFFDHPPLFSLMIFLPRPLL
jgi:hypothetical protein